MQWFKNLTLYRLNKPLELEQLESLLKEYQFTPCGSLDKVKTGWVSPFGDDSEVLSLQSNGHILLTLRKEEKMIPSPVIKRELNNKIQHQENVQQRKLKKIEKESLKDEVILDLLPRAFSRFLQVSIWINSKQNLVIVDSGSAKKAEDALSFLRKTLGSLPVTPMKTTIPIETTLTEWVNNDQLPQGFTLEYEAELKNALDGGIVRCKNQELKSDEIIKHIQSGKQITKLSLNWLDRIQFLISDDYSIKRLKYMEILTEQVQDIPKDEAALRLDADFSILTSELTQLIDLLIQTLEHSPAEV